MTRLRLCFVGPAASVTLRRWVDWFAARGHEATVLTVEPAEHAPERFRQIDVSLPSWPRKFGRLVSALRVALAVNMSCLEPMIMEALTTGKIDGDAVGAS